VKNLLALVAVVAVVYVVTRKKKPKEDSHPASVLKLANRGM